MNLTLPTDSDERKNIPLYSGVRAYFPAALAGVAKHSKAGNDKHNPGEPLHHARGTSMDHEDCIDRHLTDLADMLAGLDRPGYQTPHTEILAEVNALCWRALALSQSLHERFGAPLAPGARLPQGGLTSLTKAMPAMQAYFGNTNIIRDNPLECALKLDAGIQKARGPDDGRCTYHNVRFRWHCIHDAGHTGHHQAPQTGPGDDPV